MQLQGLLTNATYVGIIGLFVFVVVRALRRRARADIDASLFFGALAAISMLGLVFGPSRPDQAVPVLIARSVMALALPLLLLRLLEGFTDVSSRTHRLFQVGLAASPWTSRSCDASSAHCSPTAASRSLCGYTSREFTLSRYAVPMCSSRTSRSYSSSETPSTCL